MPVGQRPPGVATGPQISPRLVAGAGGRERRLVVLDWRTVSLRSQPADAGGVMEVRLAGDTQGALVLVDRIVVQTTSGTPTTARVFVGTTSDEDLVDFTGSGDIDVADEVQPILVPASRLFIIQWRGASAGAVGLARVQHRLAVMSGDADGL